MEQIEASFYDDIEDVANKKRKVSEHISLPHFHFIVIYFVVNFIP